MDHIMKVVFEFKEHKVSFFCDVISDEKDELKLNVDMTLEDFLKWVEFGMEG